MWFVVGVLLGMGLLGLVLWLRGRQIVLRWYEWLLGFAGLLLAIWAVHDFFASMAEHNEIAAWTLLWLLGIPALIFLVLGSFLPWRRYRAASKQTR